MWQSTGSAPAWTGKSTACSSSATGFGTTYADRQQRGVRQVLDEIFRVNLRRNGAIFDALRRLTIALSGTSLRQQRPEAKPRQSGRP